MGNAYGRRAMVSLSFTSADYFSETAVGIFLVWSDFVARMAFCLDRWIEVYGFMEWVMTRCNGREISDLVPVTLSFLVSLLSFLVSPSSLRVLAYASSGRHAEFVWSSNAIRLHDR